MFCWMPSPMSTNLDLATDALADMVGHMDEELPNECVGVLLTSGRLVRLINQARSPSRLFVSRDQLKERLEAFRSPVVATYHSHPLRSAKPSGTDQEFFALMTLWWPEIYHVILSPQGHKAYHVDDDLDTQEIPWLTPRSTPTSSLAH